MSIDVIFEEKDGYLEAIANGVWTPQGIKLAIRQISDHAQAHLWDHILINWVGVTPPEEEYHRFLLGVEMSTAFKPPLKVVGLNSEPMSNKFTEDTAVNRGAILWITHDREEALRWLFA